MYLGRFILGVLSLVCYRRCAILGVLYPSPVVLIVITLIIMFIIIVECSIIRRRCSSSLAKQRLHRWRQCGGALLTVIAALIHIVRTLRGSAT